MQNGKQNEHSRASDSLVNFKYSVETDTFLLLYLNWVIGSLCQKKIDKNKLIR